jgi:TonB family protein
MESIALYIFKSAIWLSVFSGIYYMFLRNERFFLLNRIYLVSGLLASLLFPLMTVRYAVAVPISNGATTFDMPTVTGIDNTAMLNLNWQMMLAWLFAAGVMFFLVRLIVQSFRIFRIIRKSDNETIGNVKVVKTDVFPAPFSFFSYVFVSPSTSEPERREIVTHEAEHIRQHHWIDLALVELLCTLQWFNPMAWFYGHYIRQNHEYLADQMALQRTQDPAIYKAVLLNQLFGGEVIRLGHLFSYSLNKKRFIMMKNTSIPTVKKLKPLLIIPAIALVFFAFAKPELQYSKIAESDFIVENEVSSQPSVENKNNSEREISNSTTSEGDSIQTVKNKEGKTVYLEVEEMPQFPGGHEGLVKYLINAIKYPAKAAEKGITGKVFVQFEVDESGKVVNTKVLRGVDPLLDAEAVRVTSEMPLWTPGKQDGKNVCVSFTLPVNFELEKEKKSKE